MSLQRYTILDVSGSWERAIFGITLHLFTENKTPYLVLQNEGGRQGKWNSFRLPTNYHSALPQIIFPHLWGFGKVRTLCSQLMESGPNLKAQVLYAKSIRCTRNQQSINQQRDFFQLVV